VTADPRGDEGSLSIEFVMLTPMIFLMLALIYLMGRVAEVHGVLDAGTRDAARVATQARATPGRTAAANALTAATKVMTAQVGTGSDSCKDSLVVTMTVLAGGVQQPVVDAPGNDNFVGGNTITVTATCNYSIADLGLPGFNGSLTTRSQFSSMIDPNRTVE
jgi:Flp pilus assembly protein TadG